MFVHTDCFLFQGFQGARARLDGETNSGLLGCLKDIELDGRRIGLPDVLETSGIESGCVWDYPCLSKDPKASPCVPGSVCFQEGTAGFRCECDGPVCTKQSSRHQSANSDPNRGVLPQPQPTTKPQKPPSRPSPPAPVPVRIRYRFVI